MDVGHLDPPRAWSVGGEQSRWFKSGAAPSTEIEQPDLRGSSSAVDASADATWRDSAYENSLALDVGIS
jgi:hypothetical protein